MSVDMAIKLINELKDYCDSQEQCRLCGFGTGGGSCLLGTRYGLYDIHDKLNKKKERKKITKEELKIFYEVSNNLYEEFGHVPFEGEYDDILHMVSKMGLIR